MPPAPQAERDTELSPLALFLLPASTPTPFLPSPHPYFHLPCILPPSFAFFISPTRSLPSSHISMVIKGEEGCAVLSILSHSIIAPFSGDTGAACGTNLPLPISSQRAREIPPSARDALSDPEPVSGCASSPPGPAAGPLSRDPAHRQGHPG